MDNFLLIWLPLYAHLRQAGQIVHVIFGIVLASSSFALILGATPLTTPFAKKFSVEFNSRA